MSARSGIVLVAVALALAVVAAGQPVWEWHLSDGSQTEVWSYGLFGATHTVTNETTGVTTAATYAYANLPGQPNLAAFFQTLQLLFLALAAAGVASAGLVGALLRRRLRGIYAGIVFVAGSLLSLTAALYPVLSLADAALDLPRVSGQSLRGFEGQLVIPGNPSTVLTWGPGFAWYVVLGLALVFAFGASEVWAVKPLRKPASKGAAKSVLAMEPPPPEPLARVHTEPVIEEVFVIGSNGLLIKHMSRTLMSEKDRDIVGSMISVVSNFVRESFSERDGDDVQEVSLGAHRFILCNEGGVVVAVLVTRGAKEDIEPRLRHLLALLFDRYGDKLEDWDGAPLEGIEDEIAVLWQPFFLPPPPVD